MGDEGLLHIWSFRPSASTIEVDLQIRETLLAVAGSMSGLRSFYAGRRGADTDPERVLAGVWDHEDALEAARRPGGLVAAEAALGGRSTEVVLPIVFSVLGPPVSEEAPAGTAGTAIAPAGTGSVTADESLEPTILRVFRGRTRPGEISMYVDAARRGTAEDIAAGAGPRALYLAADGMDGFVTVSAWAGWAPIQVATGGNIARPIATRHTAYLVAGTAAHYEIIPRIVPGPSRLAVSAG